MLDKCTAIIGEEVACQGLFDRKFEQLYSDCTAGATSCKSLWLKSQEVACDGCGETVSFTCQCCTEYKQWQKMHPEAAKKLQQEADKPCYYRVCDEKVHVSTDVYQGTIRALHAAPKGPCTGKALTTGDHPYTCDACEALQHGQNSQLLHKLWRASKLKHPRTETNRASQHGVNHKYCSKVNVQAALHIKKNQLAKAVSGVNKANEKLLRDSWAENATARPFIEQLLQLFQSNALSEFDIDFLKNWVDKKLGGRYYHANEQARSLAILLSNRFGEKMYSTISPMLGLPAARQAQRLRAKDLGSATYLPGLNDWAFSIAAKHQRPYHNSMDGTRVVRTVELYRDQYLVGESFHPDVRKFPTASQLPQIETWEKVQQYVLSVRREGRYAAEAYSFDLVDTSGKLPDLLTGSIPEPTSGVTASHVYAMMLEVERRASRHSLSLVGHCTDSASNALNALLKLATPTEYLVDNLKVSFLGLRRTDFYLFAPFFRSGFPSIAYPCWDHSGRTVLRNLMRRDIVAEVSTNASGMYISHAANIQDLHLLKKKHPTSIVKYSDISPHIRQNCDATSRVLTQTVIHDLEAHVPGSNATQLFLQAAVWTHAPYRNDKFGSPPAVVKSLWAGIMTWRRWRQYVILSPSLSLSNDFISRPHYLTEELLVHSGINHLLCMYLCFPESDLTQYSLRHTGNRGLEAIHGMFRGGTTSLPITSPNLSFREFLEKMNSAQQIHKVEHHLQQIPGNSIVASKKKRKTFAASSRETSESNVSAYALPGTFASFLDELERACKDGDKNSMEAIERLAPEMAATLKQHKQWKNPSVPLEDKPSTLEVAQSLSDLKAITPDQIAALIERELGPLTEQSPSNTPLQEEEYREALANMLIDIELPGISNTSTVRDISNTSTVRSVLRGLQPQREVPNKNRGKRFATGELAANVSNIAGHSVEEFQFWTVYPTSSGLVDAKIFLLAQVNILLSEGKPCKSAEKNPSTEVILTLYDYNPDTTLYEASGRSNLLKASVVLQTNVTTHVTFNEKSVKLTLAGVAELEGYIPFSKDINVDERLEELGISTEADAISEDEDDEEIEAIVKKQYNGRLNHYEYLVKWKGYSAKHNTWELISNIPADILDKFEQDRVSSANTSTPIRPGLRDRQTIKPRYDKNFITS